MMNPADNDQASAPGMARAATDPSRRTFADTVLIQDEQEYRLIAEAIPQIVWTARPDGYNDYFNRRWFEYTGLSEEDTYNPVTQGWPDYEPQPQMAGSALHPDDFDRYREQWKSALTTGKSYEIEYRFRRASDGMYRWHLGRATPIRDADGSIIKWFGTCTDIHDQKEAQEQMKNINKELERKVEERTRELRETQDKDRANLQRLKEIIHNLPMGAVAIDENDVILHFNHRFGTIFRIHVGPEMVGQKGHELRVMVKNSSQYPQQYLRQLEEIVAERKARTDELQLKDGRIVSRDHIPIFDNDVYRGYLLLYRDVTQEKRIDNSKSEFMSLASHQLRTPLTTIRWTLGRLERRLAEKVDAQDGHLLGEGKRAAARMADTIDTMLAISRIEAGKVKLDISRTNLPILLQELLHEFDDERDAKEQTTRLDCPPQIELQTDAKFLREIVLNLVGNALKYTPNKGNVDIVVEDGAQDVSVTVKDSGYGIPAHQQEKIFSKFFRGDNVVQVDTNGSGLGLYLVFLLTRILRGDIRFTSEEGKGTEFTLKLPKTFYEV